MGGTINVEEIEGYVEEDCMELREEKVQMVRKGEEKKERKKGFNDVGPIWGNHRGPKSVKTEGKSRCKAINGKCLNRNKGNEQN